LRVDILQELIQPGLIAHDLAGIPCYFDDPRAKVVEWGCEAKHLLSHIDFMAREVLDHGQRERLLQLTKSRLQSLGAAYLEHGAILSRVLAPLRHEEIKPYDYFLYFTRNGARASELASHYANLHRDWGWGSEENRLTFELLKSLLPFNHRLGKILALGAGACRLPYDLHRFGRPDLTVVTDINPLLFFLRAQHRQRRRARALRISLVANRYPLGRRETEAASPSRRRRQFSLRVERRHETVLRAGLLRYHRHVVVHRRAADGRPPAVPDVESFARSEWDLAKPRSTDV